MSRPQPPSRLGSISPDWTCPNISLGADYLAAIPAFAGFDERALAISTEASFQRHNPEDAGWVYFVMSGENGLIKIGWTADLRKRVLELRSQNAGALHVLGAIVGSNVLERQYHEEFAPLRHHGEWFWPHWALLDFLKWACQ